MALVLGLALTAAVAVRRAVPQGPTPEPTPALSEEPAPEPDPEPEPDVFFRLQELEAGDEVHVTYDSGDEVTFVVTASERVPKDDLPGDRIWPVTNDPLLTLITCGGEFDREIRHYRDNIIVHTEPRTDPVEPIVEPKRSNTGS